MDLPSESPLPPGAADVEAQARALAAYAVPDHQIAASLGLTLAELRERHGRAIAQARATARAAVAKAAFDRALRGEGREAEAGARDYARMMAAAADAAAETPQAAKPAGTAGEPALTCNFEEMAETLGVSKPTLRDWIAKWEDFPIISRGTNGVSYRFDPHAVVAFVAARREAEEAEKARRAELLGQIELPFGPPRTGDGREIDPAELAQLYRVARQADELAESRRQLLRVAEVRPHLSEMLGRLRSSALTLPRRWGARHNLPGAVVAALRHDIEEWLREMHAAWRTHLTEAAAPEAPETEDDEAPAAAA
jgi:DNA-binding Lrp family transcriptional regulator